MTNQSQWEVMRTASKIRKLTKHFQDISEQDKIYNPSEATKEILADNTEEEIRNILKKKRNTAPGPDGIPYIALQRTPPILFKILTKLFNASLKFGFLPQNWKTAFTIFIPKPNKSRFASANYRPITLTNTIAKICETIVAKRLNEYLETTNVLTKFQAGFRNKVSTIDQLMRIITDIQIALNKGWKAGAVFMDLTAAFDTVWHEGLISILALFHESFHYHNKMDYSIP